MTIDSVDSVNVVDVNVMCSDADLVSLAQSGDQAAFEEIDRRYRTVICRYLARHTLGEEHAEELGQQTMIRAYTMLSQLRDGSRLSGWLHRIAFRIAISASRRRTAVPLSFIDGWEAGETPRDPLVADESRQRLWSLAKEHLTAGELRVLTMRYRDELSLIEIASTLEKREGAIRVQLHRARQKLLPFVQQFFQNSE